MHRTQPIDQYDIIAHRMMIISGIILCIFGLIGNLLNIYIFTKWSRSRKKPKKSYQMNNIPLYLLVSSFANLIVIVYPLSTRIMFDGYQYRVTQKKVFILCKLRYYALHTFDLTSLTCICMATFDRYLLSSRNVRLRQLSTNKKQTIVIILLIILFLGLHNIPLTIYFDVSNTGRCTIFSVVYSHYYLYIYQISLHGLFPIVFLSIFGLLTLKQLKILAEHNPTSHLNSDRQLTRMLLLISLAIIISSTPNCIEHIYDVLFANKNEEYSSKYYLYHVISSISYYINPVASFYIFFISTPNFRLQLKHFCQYNQPVLYQIPLGH